jgi:TPR repeat protein
VPQRLGRDEIAVLVERGKRFIGSGDLAAARLVLQRAAEADDAEGALALAATYDPLVLRELNVYGIAGDPEQARIWYEKAKALGSPEAPRRLEMLASNSH